MTGISHENDIEILSAYVSFYYQNQKWSDLLLIYEKIYKLNPENDKILSKIYDLGNAVFTLVIPTYQLPVVAPAPSFPSFMSWYS